MKKMAVATSLDGLSDVRSQLAHYFSLVDIPNHADSFQELHRLEDFDYVFTNPNDLKYRFDAALFANCNLPEVIVTASTGLVHIDTKHFEASGVQVLSIREERDILESITSTAEHALLLTLASIREYSRHCSNITERIWDYKGGIGRELSKLKVGVVGLGRLGRIYARTLRALGSEIYVYDPHVCSQVKSGRFDALGYNFVNDINEMMSSVQVLSIHCHVTEETRKLITSSPDLVSRLELGEDFYLINTARGEIVDDKAIEILLDNFPNFRYATDVISDESNIREQQRWFDLNERFHNLILSPHCGGMTRDARTVAYKRAADLAIASLSRELR